MEYEVFWLRVWVWVGGGGIRGGGRGWVRGNNQPSPRFPSLIIQYVTPQYKSELPLGETLKVVIVLYMFRTLKHKTRPGHLRQF